MSQALEGTPRSTVTLTEQANGQRIPRSMFIGHSAGYLLILAIAVAALMFARFTQPVIFQMLLLASIIIHTFADAPDIVGYLDAVLVLYGLYLFVVLVILPGDRH